MVLFTVFPSPLGDLTLTSDGTSLTGLRLPVQALPPADYARKDDLPVFRQTVRWLESYFLGNTPDTPLPPLAPSGTVFQQRVWKILGTVPYGETCTYGDIARAISPTMSAQAVGGAVGRNPISILIPCHRCVGAGGSLTGYAGGIENKAWLLRHEKEHL